MRGDYTATLPFGQSKNGPGGHAKSVEMSAGLRKRPPPSSRLAAAFSPLPVEKRGETAGAASQSGVRAKPRFYNTCLHPTGKQGLTSPAFPIILSLPTDRLVGNHGSVCCAFVCFFCPLCDA